MAKASKQRAREERLKWNLAGDDDKCLKCENLTYCCNYNL